MIKTILVPLDGSSFAEQALPAASSAAVGTGAALVLVRVHAHAREQAETEQYLQRVQGQLTHEGLAVTTEILSSDPIDAILHAAQEHNADLICMSSHGATGLLHTPLGAVASAVLQRSGKPVLLVRSLHQPVSQQPTPFLKILVPLEGSSLAETALSFLAREHLGQDASILLLRVVDSPVLATPAFMDSARIAQITAQGDRETEPQRTGRWPACRGLARPIWPIVPGGRWSCSARPPTRSWPWPMPSRSI